MTEKARETQIESILGLPESAKAAQTEAELLEAEIALLEKQVKVRETQMNHLEEQCRQTDAKIEAIVLQSIEEVYEIEDSVSRDSVRTYRELQ